MLLLKRFQPVVAAAITVIAGEVLLSQPRVLVYLWPGVVVLTLASLGWETAGRSWREFWTFGCGLLTFQSGIIALLFFSEGVWFQQAVIAIAAISMYVYLTNVFYYFYRTGKYNVNALQNLSSYLNIVTVFALGFSAFSANLFLSWPVWLLTVFMLVGASFVWLQTMLINQAPVSQTWPYGAIGLLITMEVFWAVSFLPSSVFVNAAIVAIIFYTVGNILRYIIMQQLTRPVWLRYLIVGVSVLLLTMLTARWV